jgi:hypothetical protein
MRTKTLILTAALAATGIAPAMAQSNVYSVNVVGYINLPVAGDKFYLIENPLQANVNNSVTNVLQLNDVNFDGSIVFTYTNGVLSPVETFIGGFGWSPGTNILVPGRGFYFYSATAGTVTFTGSVQTNSDITLPSGFTIAGSPFPSPTSPQQLQLSAVAKDGDILFRFNTAAGSLNEIYTFIEGFGWSPGSTNGPDLNLAEGFFYFNSGAPASWVQNFSIQ